MLSTLQRAAYFGTIYRCCIFVAKDSFVEMDEKVIEVQVRRPRGQEWEDLTDAVVCEQPLEIQVHGRSLSVLMRTPGDDEDLVSGFMMTEEIVSQWGHIASMRHCTQVSDLDAVDNVMQVRLTQGIELDHSKFSRHFFGSSSCGVCGKAALEQVLKRYAALQDETSLGATQFESMMAAFAKTQDVFKRTGGLHGAALFLANGKHVVTREDIGRHNAVDKVIGWAYRHGYPDLRGHVLLVSGRVSFEIVQKALVARIPIIAAVSAPSSLAVQLAEQSNQTLLGFVRGNKMNIYSRPERIVLV